MSQKAVRFITFGSFMWRRRVFKIFCRYIASGVPRNFTSMAESGVHSTAFVTCPNSDVAKALASGLVQKKLAACVNIIPGVKSIYEWEGKIEEDDEVLMMIKTRTSRVEDLTAYVRENHPYDVCEVITTKIDQGNPAYLEWISNLVPAK